jgi:hypothetical protein
LTPQQKVKKTGQSCRKTWGWSNGTASVLEFVSHLQDAGLSAVFLPPAVQCNVSSRLKCNTFSH